MVPIIQFFFIELESSGLTRTTWWNDEMIYLSRASTNILWLSTHLIQDTHVLLPEDVVFIMIYTTYLPFPKFDRGSYLFLYLCYYRSWERSFHLITNFVNRGFSNDQTHFAPRSFLIFLLGQYVKLELNYFVCLSVGIIFGRDDDCDMLNDFW